MDDVIFKILVDIVKPELVLVCDDGDMDRKKFPYTYVLDYRWSARLVGGDKDQRKHGRRYNQSLALWMI